MARTLVTTAQLLESCADFYKRDGFVKWADVARALGVSREAVRQRIQKAVATGELDQDTFELYQSMSARRAASRYNEELRRDLDKRRPQVSLTPENYAWLRAQTELRRLTASDIINGLINRARENS